MINQVFSNKGPSFSHQQCCKQDIVFSKTPLFIDQKGANYWTKQHQLSAQLVFF
jgi:hypothetical protein